MCVLLLFYAQNASRYLPVFKRAFACFVWIYWQFSDYFIIFKVIKNSILSVSVCFLCKFVLVFLFLAWYI